MNFQPLPDRWTEDATWLAQAIDPKSRLIRLVRMDGAAYRAASFLDDRMMQAGTESRICSLDAAMNVGADLSRDDARWIFHIGHVGSTLLSRLLSELDGVLAIREPRSLRDLAEASETERPALAQALRRLMARRGPSDQAVIVKATSFVSEYAPLLVELNSPVLFLHAAPENYIASILAGENSLKELATLYSIRTRRLASRGIVLTGFDRSDALRAAAAWACEMTSLEAAAQVIPDQHILWADFDVMLIDMTYWLDRAARHFGIEPSSGMIGAIAGGPLMRRYSKALEYDYSPSLRAELIADATRQHRSDIDSAMLALANAAKFAPMLARALDRAVRES